jgi:TatA/E family protein of Tat protein translocase
MALGMTEILIIVGVAVFLFGGSKVVGWARSIGQAKQEFENASKEKHDDITKNTK